MNLESRTMLIPVAVASALSAMAFTSLRQVPPSQEREAKETSEDSVYPDLPASPPPATKVEGAAAESAADMNPYEELITGTDAKFALVPIQGGTFTMGSPAGEADRKAWEGPQVQVTVSPFWMGATEVRWDEYRQFMDAIDKRNRSKGSIEAAPQDTWADAVSRPTPPYVPMDFDMGVDGYPAISMTHFAARQYTKWLSMKTGRFYRLPTEAEWEFACRAGTTGPFSCPADEVDDHSWWFDNSDGQYQKVGTRKPNALGLYDMHGNVAEWCLDALTKDGYKAFVVAEGEAPLVDPIQWPKTLYPRVARGGHWDDDPDRLRSAARRGSNESWKVQDPQFPKSIWYHTDAQWLGIRLVRPLNPPPFKDWPLYHDAKLPSVKKIQDRQRTGDR